MSRKATPRKQATKQPIITMKIDDLLNQRLRKAVKLSDTDISKFSRIAIREKLERLGV